MAATLPVTKVNLAAIRLCNLADLANLKIYLQHSRANREMQIFSSYDNRIKCYLRSLARGVALSLGGKRTASFLSLAGFQVRNYHLKLLPKQVASKSLIFNPFRELVCTQSFSRSAYANRWRRDFALRFPKELRCVFSLLEVHTCVARGRRCALALGTVCLCLPTSPTQTSSPDINNHTHNSFKILLWAPHQLIGLNKNGRDFLSLKVETTWREKKKHQPRSGDGVDKWKTSVFKKWTFQTSSWKFLKIKNGR